MADEILKNFYTNNDLISQKNKATNNYLESASGIVATDAKITPNLGGWVRDRAALFLTGTLAGGGINKQSFILIKKFSSTLVPLPFFVLDSSILFDVVEPLLNKFKFLIMQKFGIIIITL